MLILSTCSICNTFSIDFLPTGIAAIAGTCTVGCEFFTAALADQILTAHLAVFPLPPIVGLIAAPVAVTVFLGVDGGVEHPTAAATDDFADTIISSGLLFFVSLYVYAIDEGQERRKWSWVAIVTAILVLFVLTNDLHQQVFRFQPGFANWDEDYSYGWGFILVSAWEYLLYLAAVAVLIAKCSIAKIHYRAGMILIPFVAGITMLLLLTAGYMPKIGGYNVIQFPEALCFMAAGILECCIQLGLIPTNESYGKLMQMTSVPVRISDCNGNCVYQSSAAKELTKEQLTSPDKTRIAEHTLLRRMEIPGGYGFWQEDVTELDCLNEELADAKDRLSEEAELIRLQNELEKTQAVIEQRSYVHDFLILPTCRTLHELRYNLSSTCLQLIHLYKIYYVRISG